MLCVEGVNNRKTSEEINQHEAVRFSGDALGEVTNSCESIMIHDEKELVKDASTSATTTDGGT